MTKKNPQIVHSFTSLWEYECCGEPLAVGDVVTLQHIPYTPDDVWSPLQHIDWYVGHHAVDEPYEPSRVRVLAIWEARAALEYHPSETCTDPRHETCGYFQDQPGTGSLVPITLMNAHGEGWHDDMPEPSATFTPRAPSGWLMRLEVYGD